MDFSFTPTEEQYRIFDKANEGKNNLVLEAVAGSGKTTTLVEIAKSAKGRVIIVAFNRHIAQELSEKLPKINYGFGSENAEPGAEARTIHSIGKQVIESHFGEVKIDGWKYTNIIRDYMKILNMPWEERQIAQSTLSDLVSLFRLNLVNPLKTDQLLELVKHHGMSYPKMVDHVAPVFQIGMREWERNKTIDFDDMIFLPLFLNNPYTGKLGLDYPKYDKVLVDECLPWHTPIHLADGTSLPIGKIVDEKLTPLVLTYNEITKKQEEKRIVGHRKTPNNRRTVKVKVKWRKRKGTNVPTNFVICTDNHRIYTLNRGWIKAGSLIPGDLVQVESKAHKSQVYKITNKGRKMLSLEMSRKNADPNLVMYGPSTDFSGLNGGNGTGLTDPQCILLKELGKEWIPEYVVKTGGGKNIPNHYKIDIANPDLLIAVEIDGNSHYSRKAKDKKKDSILTELGWTVIRFSNQEAVKRSQEIAIELNDNCPISAKVVSVEEVDTGENWVYDVEVEDNHNFYANGILVHNCQDLNKAQLKNAINLVKKDGQLIFVGDRRQAIMGFAGADAQSFQNIVERTEAEILDLSICFRCPSSHIKLAQEIVPQIKPRENAPEGVIRYLELEGRQEWIDFYHTLTPDDLLICRTNAPIIRCCVQMIKEGIKARVRGMNMGKKLTSILRRIKKMSGFSYDLLPQYLRQWRIEQVAYLSDIGAAESIKKHMVDLEETLRAVIGEYPEVTNINQLSDEIEALFKDTDNAIWLSSVHRAKGLEAQRVFILYPDLLPLQFGKQQDWEFEQEMNLKYVALTRSKDELIFVREKERMGI